MFSVKQEFPEAFSCINRMGSRNSSLSHLRRSASDRATLFVVSSSLVILEVAPLFPRLSVELYLPPGQTLLIGYRKGLQSHSPHFCSQAEDNSTRWFVAPRLAAHLRKVLLFEQLSKKIRLGDRR